MYNVLRGELRGSAFYIGGSVHKLYTTTGYLIACVFFSRLQVFLLNVERGDVNYIKTLLKALAPRGKKVFNINCKDPLGRSGLVIAIENENLPLVEHLLESGIAIMVSPTQL